MRLPVAIALTLVGRLIVNRLPRIVSDVDDPIGGRRNALRQARPGTQILLRLPGIDELGRINRLALVLLASTRRAATPGNDGGEHQSNRDESHSRSISGAARAGGG